MSPNVAAFHPFDIAYAKIQRPSISHIDFNFTYRFDTG